MSSLDFLAHSQLHEVLFEFLHEEDLLQYRAIHSACDAVVLHYAKTQLQDVLGQDLSAMDLVDVDVVRNTSAMEVLPCDVVNADYLNGIRRMPAILVNLLVCCGYSIREIVSSSPAGVRSISGRLFYRNPRSGSPNCILRAVESIFNGICFDWLRTLVCVDIGGTRKNTTDKLLSVVARPDSRLTALFCKGPPCLYGRPRITDAGIKLVAKNCRMLRSLNVSRVAGAISDSSIRLVATKCLLLQSLDVSSTYGITDESLVLVAMNCVHLHSLNVSETRITDHSICLIALNCQQLRSLNVSATGGSITDVSIRLVAENCRRLLSLDVSKTQGITDDSLHLVAMNCLQLERLNVSGTSITDQSIKPIVLNCCRLQWLDVCGTGGMVTYETVRLRPPRCGVNGVVFPYHTEVNHPSPQTPHLSPPELHPFPQKGGCCSCS